MMKFLFLQIKKFFKRKSVYDFSGLAERDGASRKNFFAKKYLYPKKYKLTFEKYPYFKNHNSLFVVVLITVFLLSPFANVSAAINKQVNYQGKLTDSAGLAVADGDYNMEFNLYTVASGGTAIWTETRTGIDKVTVTSGIFSILLGSVSSLSGVDFNQTLYLGVNIGGTGTPTWDGEMTPRKTIGSVPTAILADNSLTVTGLTVTSSKTLTATNTLTLSGTDGSTLNIGTGGTLGTGAYATIADYLPLAGGTMTGNLIFTDNTYDIGALDATRPRTGYFGTSLFSPLVVGGTGTTQDLTFQTTTGVGATGADMHFLVGNNGATEALTILNDGNIGVGVTNPSYKLAVSGDGYYSGTLTVGAYTLPNTDGLASYFLQTNGSGVVSWQPITGSQVFKGTWDASTNTPTLADGVGTAGWYYRVTVAGTQDLGSGSINFFSGDDISYNGSIWQRIPSGAGTVTTVSVVNANGFDGTVANASTTPAITIKTTITGLIKGNGTAISAAVADTDYLTPGTAASTYLPLAGGIMTGNILMTSNKLIGGSTTTSDLYLQTTSGVGTTGADMHFLVGNNGATEAMTILNSGYIGIGTVVPTGKLSVTPTQYSTGTASQSTTTVTGVGTTWTSAMVGSQFIFADGTNAGIITALGSATSLTVSTSQTVSSQAYEIKYNGLQVASGGNVGVGTIAPIAKLHISDGTVNDSSGVPTSLITAANQALTSEGSILNVQSTSNQAVDMGGSINLGGRSVNASTSSTAFAQVAGRKENGTSANYSGYLQFGTSDSVSDLHEWMRIDSVGNVGISTTTPQGKLHISGGLLVIDNNQQLVARNTTDNGNIPLIGTTGATNTITVGGTNVGGAISFNDGNGIKMYYANGKLRIGDSTPPTNNLEVLGTASFTGNVGIGTATVSADNLHVGDGTNTRYIAVDGAVAAESGYKIAKSGSDKWKIYQPTSSNDLRFNDVVGGSADIVTFQLGGNIGIGTTNPTTHLQVGTGTLNYANGVGDAYIQSDLEVDGTIYGNISGSFNPGFATGSVVFQGASGLAQDNTNFFWDDTSNNLGIGTNSPASKLDILPTSTLAAAGVSGIIQRAHTITLSGADPTTYATIYGAQIGSPTLVGTNINQTVTNAAGLAVTPVVKSTNVAITNTHGILIPATAVSSATNAYGITVNAPTGATNNYAAVFAGGNVGIGTTAPTAALHVYTSNNTYSVIDAPSGGVAVLSFLSAGTEKGGIYRPSGSSDIRLFTAADVMTLTSGGNVGIGTTLPGKKLEVTGTALIGNLANSSTNFPLTLDGMAVDGGLDLLGNYGGLLLSADSGYTSAARQYLITNAFDTTKFAIIRSVASTSAPALGVAGVVSSGTADFVIDGSGNVGIGATSPGYKLEIPSNNSSLLGLAITDSADSYNKRVLIYDGGTEAGALELFDSSEVSKVAFKANGFSYVNGGNLGIGIEVAGAKLDVDNTTAGTSDVTEVVRISRETTGTADVGLGASLNFALEKSSGNLDYAGRIYSKWANATAGVTQGDLILSTASNGAFSDRVTILGETGNVGIGTTAPIAKLQVGAITGSWGAIDTAIKLSNASYGAIFQASDDDSTMTLTSSTGAFNWGTTYGSTGSYRKIQITPGNNQAVILQASGTGNVGIGTASPASKLNVEGVSGTELRVSHSGQIGDVEIFSFSSGGLISIRDNGGTASIILDSRSGQNSYINTGNFGIGTASPGYKLEVNGTSYFGGDISLAGGSSITTTGTSTFSTSVTTPLLIGGTDVGSKITYKSTTGAGTSTGIAHQFIGGTNGGTTIMTMLNNGNVGIGIAAPNDKFQVAGGSIIIDNNQQLMARNTLDNGNIPLIGTNGASNNITIGGTNVGGLIYFNDGNGIKGVYSNGKLRLGDSSTPSSALEVVGIGYFSGNVGIANGGVASYSLQVGDGTNSRFITTDSAIASNGGFKINKAGSEEWAIYQPANSNDLRFTDVDGGAGDMVTFQSGGNVGIGTTTPGGKLDVIQTGTSGTVYAVIGQATGAATTNIGAYFGATGATNNYGLIVGSGNVGIGNSSPATKLHISDTASVNIAEKGLLVQNPSTFDYLNIWNYSANVMAIESADETTYRDLSLQPHGGNVGIGTTAPGSPLSVVGTIRTQTSSGVAPLIDFYQASIKQWQIGNPASATRFSFLEDGTDERMVILAGGNVGIGTTAPGAKLDIESSEAKVVDVNSTSGVGSYLAFQSSGTTLGLFGAGVTLFTNGGTGIRSTSGVPISFSINSATPSMVVDTSGNVGIGTTAPADKLEVYAGSDTASVLWGERIRNEGNANVTGYGAGIRLKNSSDGGVEDNKWAGIAAIAGSGFSNRTDLAIYTDASSAAAPTEKVRITGGGNVGIGTTAPDEALEVKVTGVTAGTYAVPGLKIRNSADISSKNTGISFGSPSWGDGAAIIAEDQGSDGRTALVFATRGTIASGVITENMRIYNGNVGIGTTGPNAKLDIALTYSGVTDIPFKVSDQLGYGMYVFAENTLGTNYGVNADSAFWINYAGYAGGYTQFRDLSIANGKGGLIANFDGSTGNVGIGTASPDLKLHVNNGSILVSGDSVALRHDLTSEGGSEEWQMGTDTASGATGFYLYDTIAAKYLIHSNQSNGDLLLNHAGGNVGIGTASPAGPLEVYVAGSGSVNDDPTSGMLTNSGLQNYSAANLLDENTSSQGFSSDSSAVGSTLTIDLGVGNGKDYVKTRWYASGTYPSTFDIQYSDNGSSWTTVVTGFAPNGTGWHESTWASTGATRRYWRFYLTANGAGNFITQIEMYSVATGKALLVATSGNVGIGDDSPAYKLEVGGDVNTTFGGYRDGGVCAIGTCASDIALKTNIVTLGDGSLDKIMQLKPSTFSFLDPKYGSTGVNYGFIAQEVETVFPDWVVNAPDGYKAVRYGLNITMHMLRAMQEQQAIINNITGAISISETGNIGIGTTTPSSIFEIGSSDLGDGLAGPVFTLGRNTNATNSAAGSINFINQDGTAGYVWQDVAGNLRINNIAPDSINDTSGTIIGAQTSTRSTKQDIADYTDYNGALEKIISAPLHTFRYIKEVQGYGEDSPLAKMRIGYIADEVDPQFMIGNVIDQVSVNGLLMGSIKALNIKLTSIEERLAALEANTSSMSPSFGEYATEFFTSGLKGMKDGIAYMKGIVTESLTIGSSQKRTGITFFDEVTGDPYCVSIANGTQKVTNGSCIVVDITKTPNPDALATDTVAPIVTLDGDAVVSLNVGDTYVEQGALAQDDTDGDVPVVISGDVDTSVPGTYTITYYAIDSAGNYSIKETRTITVASADSSTSSEPTATTTTTTTTDPAPATTTTPDTTTTTTTTETTVTL